MFARTQLSGTNFHPRLDRQKKFLVLPPYLTRTLAQQTGSSTLQYFRTTVNYRHINPGLSWKIRILLPTQKLIETATHIIPFKYDVAWTLQLIVCGSNVKRW